MAMDDPRYDAGRKFQLSATSVQTILYELISAIGSILCGMGL
jgi:hypothetical protein